MSNGYTRQIETLQSENSYGKIDQGRANRVKLYFYLLRHLKGALDTWWQLQFGEQPPVERK